MNGPDPARQLAAAAPPAPDGALVRARHWVREALFPDTCKARLPITGLSSAMAQIPAHAAALLLCADLDSRERLLATIAGQLRSGRNEPGVTWLCAAAKAPLFMEAELSAPLRDGQLRVLAWSEEAAAQVRENGPAHLLRELHSSGMRPGDLLIVDLIEPWMEELPEGAALEAGVTQALDNLVSWCRDHDGPILALAPTHRRGSALLPIVARAKLARLALLHVQGTTAQLDVVRWGNAHIPGPHNLCARLMLEIPPQGPWRYRHSAPLNLRPLLTAADERIVHALAGVLHDAPAAPAGWQAHGGLEALLAATGRAVGATVVLDFDRPESLPALASAVCRLRRAHPRLLRILVRETGATMRRNGELALTRIGANAIVRRDLGFAQLEELIEDLRGEQFLRPAVTDPARLLQRLAPDAVQGYLAPLAFCSAVERMLERTAETPLEHTLVHLPLLAHVSHRDALQACLPRRDGDLVSADGRGLYLFFFACPGEDAMAALDSIFELPCSELAQHVQIDDERHTQRAALADLRRRHSAPAGQRSGAAPALARAAPLRPRGAAEAAPAAADAATAVQRVALPMRVRAGRSVHAHELPLRTATH